MQDPSRAQQPWWYAPALSFLLATAIGGLGWWVGAATEQAVQKSRLGDLDRRLLACEETVRTLQTGTRQAEERLLQRLDRIERERHTAWERQIEMVNQVRLDLRGMQIELDLIKAANH
jgi:hypothetical protein